MPLPINPQATFVSRVVDEIQRATNEAQASFVAASNELEKLELDNKVSRLSGELNSGLNGLAGQVSSNISNFSSTVQSGVSRVTSTLQSVTGSTSNIAADISGGLEKLGAGSLAGGLQNFAGAVSKTAGMLNNILSLTRAANLPAGAELFSTEGPAIKVEPTPKNDWRVRVTCNWPILGGGPMFSLLENTGGVVFPYTPQVHIGSKANYTAIEPTHTNYALQTYKNSVIDDITIVGDFSAETQEDAAYWLASTTFFKTATKMFYGQGANLGNPPIVCKLSGYGPNIFPNVPVVIKGFEVELGPETDYIKCERFGDPTWVPVFSTVSITLTPIYSRSRLRQFSLQEYGKGKIISQDGIGFM
jgi:hypothetical protein